ncbi:hypothetical protein BDR04DRAFT_1118342 [Suillus decipiens]|nr:hypothetical protein BDR04DRAFT_1118342 [Suillus decipiens]
MATKIAATTENAHVLMQAMVFTYMPSYTIPPSVSLWWINVSFSMEVVDRVPVHYQWFPTDIGLLDPCTLKATDYDNFNWEKHQTWDMKIDEKQHGEIKKPGRVAKVVKGKAQFYRMSNKGRNKTLISRGEYKHLSQSFHMECLKLPTREVCTIFEDNNNDNEASGLAIMMVNGAAHQARPTAGVMTTQAVLSQTQTQTCHEEMPTIAGTPAVTLGVTNIVPSEVQAETPHKQMCMVADMQALVLPDIKNMNAQKGQ